MGGEIHAAKSALRKRLIAARDALDAGTHRRLSAQIAGHLLALNALRDVRCIMAYASFGSEFDTSVVLGHIIASGRQLVLPRTDRATKSLQLYCVCDLERDLQPGVWGIREPVPQRCAPVSDDAVQLVLVPGVAFTERGARLGYGGGYYDKFVARLPQRPALIAATFSLQVVPEIPITVNDQKVDALVTEQGVIRCS